MSPPSLSHGVIRRSLGSFYPTCRILLVGFTPEVMQILGFREDPDHTRLSGLLFHVLTHGSVTMVFGCLSGSLEDVDIEPFKKFDGYFFLVDGANLDDDEVIGHADALLRKFRELTPPRPTTILVNNAKRWGLSESQLYDSVPFVRRDSTTRRVFPVSINNALTVMQAFDFVGDAVTKNLIGLTQSELIDRNKMRIDWQNERRKFRNEYEERKVKYLERKKGPSTQVDWDEQVGDVDWDWDEDWPGDPYTESDE